MRNSTGRLSGRHDQADAAGERAHALAIEAPNYRQAEIARAAAGRPVEDSPDEIRASAD